MLFFSALSYDGIDKADDLLVYFVSFENSLDHLLLRNFLGTSFDHDNFLSGRSYSQSHLRYLSLSGSWVDNKFTINKTNLGSSARSVKWDIRNAGSDSRTKHSSQLWAAVWIYRHNYVV